MLFSKIVLICLFVLFCPIIYILQRDSSDKLIKKLTLDNGLDVLLVHDKNFKNSFVHIAVDAGHIYNPKNYPGLAHLCEHEIIYQSSEYPEQNSLLNFSHKCFGSVKAFTRKENMTFHLKFSEKYIKKAVDMLAWALCDPLFLEENLEGEINVVDQEFHGYLNKPEWQLTRLTSFAIDESFPEHTEACGNKETLSVPGLHQELKEFHLKHFTPDRMKLVICSKLPMKELTMMAKTFDILPKKKSQEFSLVSKPVAIKYSDKFAGKIVKYNSNKSNTSMRITINIPSVMHLFKHRPMEYLKKLVIELNANATGIELFSLIKSLNIVPSNFKRTTEIILDFEFATHDLINVDKVIEIFYTYIHSQIPDIELFNSIAKSLKAESLNSKDEEIKTLAYLDALYDYPFENLNDFNTICEYNEDVLKKMFDAVGNLENWVVFVSTNETNLPNTEKIYSVKYSNPVPVTLPINYSIETDKKLELQKSIISKKQNAKAFDEAVKMELQQLKSAKSTPIIHKTLEHGEYLVSFYPTINDMCEVILTFNFGLNDEEAAGNLIFWQCFLSNLKIKLPPSALVNFNFHGTMPLGCINIRCSQSELMKAIKDVMNYIKGFKPTEAAISFARTEMKAILSKYLRQTTPFQSLLPEFMNFISKNASCYDILKKIDEAECKLLSEYYISIMSLGCVTENETKHIYDLVKSTSSKDSVVYSKLTKYKHSFKTFDPDNTGFLALYPLYDVLDSSEDYKIKQFATGLGFRSLLTSSFLTFFRTTRPIAYSFDLKIVSFRGKSFIGFFLQSTNEIDKIENYFMEFIDSITEITNNLSSDDFSSIKKEISNALSISLLNLPKEDELRVLTNYMNSFGIYDNNLPLNFQKIADSLTKKDLLDSLKIFKCKPLIIHTERERGNNPKAS